MSVQYRPHGSDGPFYSPGRDVAHNFPVVVEEIVRRSANGRWPQLDELLECRVSDPVVTALFLRTGLRASVENVLGVVGVDADPEAVRHAVGAPFENFLADRESRLGPVYEDMAKALEGLAVFVAEPPKKGDTMEGCLEASGFLAAPGYAQVAVLAILGAIMAGMYFAGSRDVTIDGKGPAEQARHLVEEGREFLRVASYPAWLRPFRRLARRVYKAFTAFREKS